MKTIKILFIAILAMAGTSAMAQSKLAYINSQEIIMAMPEMDSIQAQSKAQRQEFQDQMESMQAEFANKMSDYNKNYEGWTEAMKQQKGKELENLRTNIESFGQAAPQQLQKLEQDLYEPLIKKVRDAVMAVGKENGFTYIFDSSTGSLAYIDEATATNAAALVKAKLGLKN